MAAVVPDAPVPVPPSPAPAAVVAAAPSPPATAVPVTVRNAAVRDAPGPVSPPAPAFYDDGDPGPEEPSMGPGEEYGYHQAQHA
ncbi:MAG: hypothetical protein JWM31_2064, partial [Solirubrobacterales bacterium]|nr:hypothetical protein [Solirubrobacterales bacterium]